MNKTSVFACFARTHRFITSFPAKEVLIGISDLNSFGSEPSRFVIMSTITHNVT